jgi:transposase
VITDPKRNRWIGSSGKKEDAIDAEKLAHLARGGHIKEVYHPVGERRRLRELLIAYHDTVRNTVRLKNKIKAKFLQNGIAGSGETVYLPEYRQKWRQQLPQAATLLLILDSLWKQLDQVQKTEKTILSEAKVQDKKYPEIKLLDEIPGLGSISAATIVAILGTPHRFPDKRKIRMYAGLGIEQDSSGGKIYGFGDRFFLDFRFQRCPLNPSYPT